MSKRIITSTRARLDLMDAIADMMHVVRAEAPVDSDPDLVELGRELYAFNAIWSELDEGVSRAQGHYEAEAVNPDKYAGEIEVRVEQRSHNDDD